MKIFSLISILTLFLSFHVSAQTAKIEQDSKTKEQNSEDVFLTPILIDEVKIFSPPRNWNATQYREYNSLAKKVKKVYPMAQMAAVKLYEYNRVYSSFATERERKNYIKMVEKELFSEFEGEIRNMRVSEGRILIKLLDRQTGNSSYEIIKEFKGGFSAFFWQGIAKIFGHNLKAQYDAQNEDKMIEYIVWQIDMGLI